MKKNVLNSSSLTNAFLMFNLFQIKKHKASFSKTVLTLTLLLSAFCIQAATITSTANGGTWTTGSTWVGGVAPSSGDTVIIATTGSGSVNISGTMTQNAAGSVTINNGALLRMSGGTITFGALTVNSGGTITIRRTTTILGATNITGRINFGSTSGFARTITFNGAVTLNAGAVWDETNVAANTVSNTYVIKNNFVNNATTFTPLTGSAHNFTATGALSGSTTTTMPRATFTAAYTNNGKLTSANLLTVTGVTLTNNGTITAATSLAGTGGVTQGATAILNIGGTSGITTLAATTVGNIVNYTGAAQTIHTGNYSNLNFSGSGAKTLSTGTTNIGSLSLSGTATTTTVVNLAITNNLTINTGTIFTTGNNFTLGIGGSTTVAGSLVIGGTGTKTFTGDVTINGVWNESAVSAINFGGNFTNNATTFTSNTGNHTFTGATKIISGTTSTIIPTATFTGAYTINSIFTSATALTVTGVSVTNNSTVTATTSLTGTGSFIQGATGVLRLNGTIGITTLNAATAGNTVNYTGAGQTAYVTTYSNLTLSGSGTKTFATSPTINSVLSIEGTAVSTVTTGVINYGTSAALQYNTATARTATTEEWISPFVASGGIIIKSTGAITTPGVVQIGNNTNVPLNINAGATLTPGANLMIFHGDFINDGTLTSGSGGITITGTAATQSIDTFTTTGAVTFTKTSGTAMMDGNANAGTLTINGSGGTLNLGIGRTHTFTGVVTLTAGTLNGGSSTLNVNAVSAIAWSGTGSVFVASTGTVNFGATGAQTIAANSSFYNLGFSGSGVKMLSNATSISNNFAISGTAVANLGTGLTHSALSLTLGGVSQVIGTWGSTASTAVNKNATWFGSTATGIININCNAPSSPTSGGNKVICSGTTIPALTVTVSAGQVVDWYNQISGGTLLQSNSTFYTPSVAGNYYAETRVSATGCLSATRTLVSLTINSNPSVPSLTGSTICASPGGNGTISTTTSQTGVNYQLYNSSNATVQAAKTGTGAALSWTALAAGNGYYVIATNAATGCFSTSTTTNVATNANPTALVLTGSTICANPGGDGTITSSTSQTEVNYQLYNSSNVAVQAIEPGTGSAIAWTDLDALNGYYVLGTNGTTGCVSSNSNAVNIATTANPVALVITGSSICASPGGNGTITSTTSVAGIEYQLIDDLDDDVGDPIIGTGAALTFTNVPAGTGYYVEAINLTTGCASVPSNAVNISTNPNPTNKTITVSSATICIGTGANIIVGGSLASENYQLINNLGNTNIGSALTGNGSSLNLPTGNLTATTTFNVLATITATGCTTVMSTTPTITVNPNNTAGAASSSPTLCANTALTPITHTTTGATGIGTATGLPAGVTAAWAANTITISGTPTASGSFSYSIPLTGGCGNVNASGTITVNSSSVAPTGITGTTTICNGNSTTLTVSGGTAGTGATAQWFTGSCGGTSAGTGNSITVSPSSSTTYYVRYSGTCNTTACVSQLVTVNTVSVVPTGITGTTTICNGNSTTLTVSGGTAGTGATAQWFTGSCGGTSVGTGNSITVSPSSSTTYYVRYSGTCNTTACASQLVTVNTLSVVPTGITGTTTICNGNSTTLTVSGGTIGTGATAQWFTGSCGGTSVGTGNSITVSPSSSTTYYVRYSGTCNTTACASQLVTVNTLSVVPTGITGTTTICNGNSTTLTVSGGTAGTGATAQWFTGSCGGTSVGTGNSITVSPSSSTTYYVRYSGTCNTTVCVSQLVTVNTVSVVPTGITGTTTICNGSSTTLTVSGGTAGTGATAQWFTGSCGGTSAGTGNSITVSPSSSTTYYVRYSGTCNTTACTSQLVSVNPISTAATISGTASICSGSATNLQVAITNGVSPYTVVYTNGTSNFTVNGYTSGANISVSPTSTTTYTLVSVTSTGGCAGTGNTGSAVVTLASTSTSNGSTWTNGTPTATKDAIFTGNATIGTDLNACSLKITNNAVVSVNPGFDVELNGAIIVDSGSSFTMNNNANLIQNIPNGTSYTNSGNIVVKRNSSALKRLDYTLWSSPVAGQGLYAFSPFTLPNRFYIYNTTNDAYSNAVGFNLTGLQYPSPLVSPNGVNGTDTSNVPFVTGKSYLIRVPWDHPTTATAWNGSFTGVPNNGNVTYAMTTGYNAVGNPYPSRINVQDFINANANISGPLYLWRKTNNSSADSYATLTKTAYVANGYPGGDTGTGYFNTGNESNWVLNIGQGFIVNATSSTNLNFTNTMRRSSNANQFFRGSQTTTNSANDGLYWLNLTADTGIYSQMAVGYSSEGTLAEDRGIDGKNINREFYLTSLIGTDEYSIQGRPDFQSNDVVPLSYKVTTAGNYTVSIDHTSGMFNEVSQPIYIKDNLTATQHDLKTGAYTFTSAAGTFNNRFEIIYQSQLANPTFTPNNVVIYNQNNGFVIKSGNFIMSSIKVFDINGRLIEEKKDINANQTTITAGLANEVLLVQVTSEDGIIVTKKVIR